MAIIVNKSFTGLAAVLACWSVSIALPSAEALAGTNLLQRSVAQSSADGVCIHTDHKVRHCYRINRNACEAMGRGYSKDERNHAEWVQGEICPGDVGDVNALPPSGFFSGKYEMLGRPPGNDSKVLQDRLEMRGENDKLHLKSCKSGEGSITERVLRDEHETELTGTLGDWTLNCEYQVDRGNYPRLICTIPSGSRDKSHGRVTFWPIKPGTPDYEAGC